MSKFKVGDEVRVTKLGLASSGARGGVIEVDYGFDHDHVKVEWDGRFGDVFKNWFNVSSLELVESAKVETKSEPDEEVKVCMMISADDIEFDMKNDRINRGWKSGYETSLMIVGTNDEIETMIMKELDAAGEQKCFVVIDNKLKEVKPGGLVFEDVII